jgi:L-asparagine transporter-like permease
VASGCLLSVYAGVALSAIRLRVRDGLPAAGRFRLPFGITIPLLACAVVVWLLFHLSRSEAIAFVSLVAVAAVVYPLMRLLRARSEPLSAGQPTED